MKVEWRPIEGWDYYEVSNTGLVRSKPRVTIDSLGRRTEYPSRILARCNNTDQYPIVSLREQQSRRTPAVHRLVAAAFLGPRPEGMDVCHQDGQKWNNNVLNLRYDTRSNNVLDNVPLGRHNQARKTHCPQGHPYDEKNTYHSKTNRRHCRECSRIRCREYQRRRYAESIKTALAS